METVGVVFSLGILLATNAINVAHELGHRKTRIEQMMSKALLLPCLYMHFYLEHNFGHHKNVSTPEDPATSKYNQSLYHFWVNFCYWSIYQCMEDSITIIKHKQ